MVCLFIICSEDLVVLELLGLRLALRVGVVELLLVHGLALRGDLSSKRIVA